jgi:hypothetical protein
MPGVPDIAKDFLPLYVVQEQFKDVFIALSDVEFFLFRLEVTALGLETECILQPTERLQKTSVGLTQLTLTAVN